MPQLTPNQIVAWNLRRARQTRGWTQVEAAAHLEPYLGTRWSEAVFSSAERSVDGKRVREFTADDIHAFAQAFGFPLTYFLTPPDRDELQIGPAASEERSSLAEYRDMVFDVGEDAPTWLLRGAIPLTAETTRALRRWEANFTAMVAYRDREVAPFEKLARRDGEAPEEDAK
jgi:hypothetical protein